VSSEIVWGAAAALVVVALDPSTPPATSYP
jgi:hypothetical protein